MTKNEAENIILPRRKYFETLLPKLTDTMRMYISDFLPNTCPACGYPTLESRNRFELCEICFWEDDGQDNEGADAVWGGPNGDDSLTAYRIRFLNSLSAFPGNPNFLKTKKELDILDKYIEDNEQDIAKVTAQVSVVMDCFEELRSLNLYRMG